MKLTKIQTEDLIAFMAPYDMDDLPDGAWFHILEETAEEFIESRRLKGWDENSLVHYYLNHKSEVSA
jgi:hypothetical protein